MVTAFHRISEFAGFFCVCTANFSGGLSTLNRLLYEGLSIFRFFRFGRYWWCRLSRGYLSAISERICFFLYGFATVVAGADVRNCGDVRAGHFRRQSTRGSPPIRDREGR